MDIKEFEKIVLKSVENIPEKFKQILEKENIRLIIREKVPNCLSFNKKNSIIFGLFIGISYNKRSVFNINTEPTRIELYKESFEKVFDNTQDIEDQVQKTVVHEIGHYFGFSEKELRDYSL